MGEKPVDFVIIRDDMANIKLINVVNPIKDILVIVLFMVDEISY